MEAAQGAPAFVKLSAVVQHTMERAYGALVAVMDSYASPLARSRDLCEAAPARTRFSRAHLARAATKSDKERKQLLYEWFVRTRASVIRLLVVLKWARTVPDINHTRVRARIDPRERPAPPSQRRIHALPGHSLLLGHTGCSLRLRR